jgi:hypothetical protein
MKRIRFLSSIVLAAMVGLSSLAAAATGWKHYEAKSYAYSMLVPVGVAMKEREWGGGWGGLTADFEGVKLNGLAKLGAKESDAEIEKFAVRTIGIPAREWTRVDSGEHQQGWERYRTFQATRGAKLYFGGYGVGRQGNYLLFLETTVADFNAHKADYMKWYESIRLE